jgi:hypothetical protein
MNKKQKVFGIGLHRTGTTSLRAALIDLNYDVVRPWRWTGRYSLNLKTDNVLADAMHLAENHDGCVYMPFTTFYKELYEKYPDAKFILTERDKNKWVNSMCNFFSTNNWPEVRFVFGMNADPNFKDKLKDHMNSHNQSVKDFFKDKPNSLLVMNIGKGDRWHKLCNFLEEPVPKKPFPRVNASGSLYALFVANAIPLISTIRSLFTGEKIKNTPTHPL